MAADDKKDTIEGGSPNPELAGGDGDAKEHVPTFEDPVPMDSISLKKSADGTDPEAAKAHLRAQAPAYVKSLSPQEREAAEKALVRKIDIRLIPILILMYIMNYLDR